MLRLAEDGPQCIAPSTRHCAVVQPRAKAGILCNVSHAAYFTAFSSFIYRAHSFRTATLWPSLVLAAYQHALLLRGSSSSSMKTTQTKRSFLWLNSASRRLCEVISYFGFLHFVCIKRFFSILVAPLSMTVLMNMQGSKHFLEPRTVVVLLHSEMQRVRLFMC